MKETDALTAIRLAKNAEKAAEGLLKTVLGPPADELGQLLKEKVSARRYQNLVKIAANAKEQLDSAGLSPKEVPLAIIHPLLEIASLEEDESLQKRWAALLANVSLSDSETLRCFADILKQLTSVEARFLDKAYDERFQSPRQPDRMAPPKKYPVLENTLALLRTSMIANLERLGLITRQSHDHTDFTSSFGTVVTATSNRLYVSDLGMEFIQACRPLASQKSLR